MTLPLITEPIPLRSDADGVLRVGNTRVTLDTVAAAFQEGMTPEGIVEQYPTLALGQVYSVIGYLLNHTAELETYQKARLEKAEAVRRENEARFPSAGIRERLLARR
jgi:uncharacterized protein (DUF433 family)